MSQPLHPDHGGQIVIGLRDLYAQLQQVTVGQSALSAKLDTTSLLAAQAQQSHAQQMSDLRHDISDHEMRIRAIEARPVVSPAAVWTGVSVIVGVLGFLFVLGQVIFK